MNSTMNSSMNTQERTQALTEGAQAPPHRTPSTNGPAGAALVLGVIGLGTSVFLIGGLFGCVGLVLGVVALTRAGRTAVGRGSALTGLVTSALAIAVSVLVAVFFVWYADKTQECYEPDGLRQYAQCVHQQLTGK
ncbi:DUF4190 domain-containing protein [Streptomyces sp. PvR034]|uniref:DUF4190 domain-containing protein n=1 Tax=Streptomyces sp. PvR034 TaxID=3156401 RepID=UPI003397ED1C